MKAVVTVVGEDRVGIIAAVCGIMAENNINVLDISQTVLQGYFTMTMIVDTSASKVDFADLTDVLKARGEDMGLSIRAQSTKIFKAMHRI